MDKSKKNIDKLLNENKLLKAQLATLEDIDRKHKLAEDALKNSTESLRIIFDSASDAFFLMDSSGVFIAINNLFEKVIGRSKDAIVGKSILKLDLLSDGEFQKINKGIELNLCGESFGPKEILVKNTEGELVYLEISTYPVIIDNRTIIIGIACDVSEQKKAEEIIQGNEQQLALHFNQTPLGIIEWDLNFNVIKWNPAAERILGYSKKEALGKHVSFILQKSFSKEEIESLWKSFVISETGKKNINENVRKGGEVILCEWFNKRLINKENKVFAVASWVQNVSERERNNKIQKVLYNISKAVNTTDNLHKLIAFIRDELSNIIDTTNFYIALYNGKNDTFTLPFFVDEVDEFNVFPTGKTLTKHVVKMKKPFLVTSNQKGDLEKQGIIETIGADSKVWLGVPLITEGEITGVLAVQSYDDENAFDTTDVQMLEFVSDQISLSIHRKKTEDELMNALKKAEESDKLKTAFLQNMSHEIRTPMNGILGFTALLKESELNGEEQREYLHIIEKSGERMLNTINNLMDISKIEAGQMDVVISEIKINKQIDYLQSFFQLEAEKKGLKLCCEKGLLDKEDTLYSDREKLFAILTNLIKNAIKYTKKGSIVFGYLKKKQSIEFFVKDTGIGISKMKLESVFDRFVQVHQDSTSKYEGTGLGLSITKAYVELLGGTIGAESEYGAGSTFYFEIPQNIEIGDKRESEIMGHEIEQKQNKNCGVKILIAEDDETIRTYLSISIRKITPNVLFAKDGNETVEICRNNPDIDLILMDIKMPGVDGYEATKLIREFNNDVVIVAQTAFDYAIEKPKMEAAGCTDYLPKPVRREALQELIEKYFKKGV